MTDRAIHRSAALGLALAFAMSVGPASASVHHRADHRPTSRHHTDAAASKTKTSHHRSTNAVRHQDARPSGVTSVPAGGLKLFCPAHRNPLLIRKSTQGAGTTVTVVCR